MKIVDRPRSLVASRLARIYAAGTIGLGLVGIAFHDFALQWQPIPAGLPARDLLAVVFGVGSVCCGVALLAPALVAGAALAAALIDTLWVVALLVPKLASAPGSVAAWLGVAEISSIAAAAWLLHATATGRLNLERGARIAFGACALVFGLSHFAYADFTASMVPSWLPQPIMWAYATGLGHVLVGSALIAGTMVRQAATAHAAMCGSFVVLLHVPRVMSAPGSHVEWTMLFVAVSIAGAAWTMRGAGASQSSATSDLAAETPSSRIHHKGT